MEFNAAAAILARAGPAAPTARSGPAASTVYDHGEITALATVTGIVDDVGDVLEPGYFPPLAARTPPRMWVGRRPAKNNPGLRT